MIRLLEILGRGINIDTADLLRRSLLERLTPQDSGQPTTNGQVAAIVDVLDDGKLLPAKEQLRIYLLKNPGCVEGRLAAAYFCLRDNNLQQAIQELTSVYIRQPNNTVALYALGHCYERLGREPEALEFYQDCLKFKGYLKLPAQRLAAIYFKNGQPERTIQHYEVLEQQYPDDITTLLTLGYLYIGSGDYLRAIKTFNDAILLHPDNFLTHDDNIDKLLYDGRVHEALDHLQELIERQPDKPDLIARKADILSTLGATAEAIANYQQALSLCPDFLEATVKLGSHYAKIHSDEPAAQQFNRAVEINDKIVDAYFGLASAQKLAGRTSDALTTLSLAAAIQPNSSLLFAHAASLIFQPALDTQDYQAVMSAVIKAHERHLAHDPHNPDLHYRLGLLLMAVSSLAHAIRCFRQAGRLNPMYTRAQVKLALCLFETGQHTEALALLASPISLSKQTLDLHYKTAILYCDRVRFASSMLNLQKRVEHSLASSTPACNIAVVLQNLGLSDRAADMWDNLRLTANYTKCENLQEI